MRPCNHAGMKLAYIILHTNRKNALSCLVGPLSPPLIPKSSDALPLSLLMPRPLVGGGTVLCMKKSAALTTQPPAHAVRRGVLAQSPSSRCDGCLICNAPLGE